MVVIPFRDNLTAFHDHCSNHGVGMSIPPPFSGQLKSPLKKSFLLRLLHIERIWKLALSKSQPDWAMIRSLNLRMNACLTDRGSEIFGYHKIINPPANIRLRAPAR